MSNLITRYFERIRIFFATKLFELLLKNLMTKSFNCEFKFEQIKRHRNSSSRRKRNQHLFFISSNENLRINRFIRMRMRMNIFVCFARSRLRYWRVLITFWMIDRKYFVACHRCKKTFNHNDSIVSMTIKIWKISLIIASNFFLNLITNSINRRLVVYENWERVRQRSHQKMSSFKNEFEKYETHLSFFDTIHSINFFFCKLLLSIKKKLLNIEKMSTIKKNMFAKIVMLKNIIERKRRTNSCAQNNFNFKQKKNKSKNKNQFQSQNQQQNQQQNRFNQNVFNNHERDTHAKSKRKRKKIFKTMNRHVIDVNAKIIIFTIALSI